MLASDHQIAKAYTFDRVPARARELLPVIGATAYSVLGVLVSFANDDGKCWPSQKRIARDSGVSRSTINRELKKLEENRLIIREQSLDRSTTRYTIVYQPCGPPSRVVAPATHSPTNDTGDVAPAKQPMSHQRDTNKNHRTKTNNKKSSPTFDAIDSEHARQLLANIRTINPAYREPNFDKWASDFRLLRTADNRAPEQIANILTQVAGDPFWRKIVLSPAKLREKWDTIETQRLAGKQPTQQSLNEVTRPSKYINQPPKQIESP